MLFILLTFNQMKYFFEVLESSFRETVTASDLQTEGLPASLNAS